MIGLMEIETEINPNKVLINKRLRDEILEVADEQIELKIEERNVIKSIIDVINKRFKKSIELLRGAKKKYKIDKKASKKALKAKLRAEKRDFKEAKKIAKEKYKKEIMEFYKPVMAKKNNITSIKEEKKGQIEMLQDIKKEILDLQKYKAYIDKKYTSDKDEYIDKELIPKVLRKK